MTSPTPSRPKVVFWTVAVWLIGHVALIAAAIAVVLAYSVAVAPGLETEAYTEFANASGPWVSIVFGGPVFWALGRMLVGRLGVDSARRSGLIAWGLYSVTDFVIVSVAGTWGVVLAVQWVASQSIKLVGMWVGTRGPVRDHR